MVKLLKFRSKKLLILIVVSFIIFLSVIIPFLPSSVKEVSLSTVQETLIPIYKNNGFEDTTGDQVIGWKLSNGSKLTRTEVYDGNNAINMTPSNPSLVPQIIYAGKNATTGYIIGGNVILSLAIKASKALNSSKSSYISVESIILYQGQSNVSSFIFNLVLYRNMVNASKGVSEKEYGILAYESLKNSDGWFEYSLQMSKLTGVFSDYLKTWKGIDTQPTDRYGMLGLDVWCDNLTAYVDDVSIYEVEPEWIMATMRSNSIIPMNLFLSDVEVNGSTNIQFFTKPNIVLPISTFYLYTFIPYIPANNSINIVTVRFGTGQTVQFQFKEVTRRVWLTL